MSPRLIPVNHDQSNIIHLHRPIILIGRHEECDFTLESRKISRKHCLIAVLPGQLIIRDLGSTNGVLVNGKKVLETRLLPGDELEIGGALFRYELAPARSSEEPLESSGEELPPPRIPVENGSHEALVI